MFYIDFGFIFTNIFIYYFYYMLLIYYITYHHIGMECQIQKELCNGNNKDMAQRISSL